MKQTFCVSGHQEAPGDELSLMASHGPSGQPSQDLWEGLLTWWGGNRNCLKLLQQSVYASLANTSPGKKEGRFVMPRNAEPGEYGALAASGTRPGLVVGPWQDIICSQVPLQARRKWLQLLGKSGGGGVGDGSADPFSCEGAGPGNATSGWDRCDAGLLTEVLGAFSLSHRLAGLLMHEALFIEGKQKLLSKIVREQS